MKVQELMTQTVKTVQPGDPLSRAAQLMWEADCGAVPVIDAESRVVGMITDRDVCMAAYTRGASLNELPVASAMSRQLHVCRSGDTLEVAAQTMRGAKVRRLPVVDSRGQLVGVVSLSDLTRAARGSAAELSPTDLTLTLAAICEPHQRTSAAPAAARATAPVNPVPAAARARTPVKGSAKKTR